MKDRIKVVKLNFRGSPEEKSDADVYNYKVSVYSHANSYLKSMVPPYRMRQSLPMHASEVREKNGPYKYLS